MYVCLHVCDHTCVGVYALVNVGVQRSQIDLRCHPHSLSTLMSQGHLAESGAHPSGLSNWPVCSGNMLSHLMLELLEGHQVHPDFICVLGIGTGSLTIT